MDKETELEKEPAKDQPSERPQQPSEEAMGMCSDSCIPPVHNTEPMDVCMDLSPSQNFISLNIKDNTLKVNKIEVLNIFKSANTERT